MISVYYKRRVTENVFSIWLNRLRVFSVRNNLNERNVATVVLASLVLHSMLRQKSTDTYTPSGFADEIDSNGYTRQGFWRTELDVGLLCQLQLARNNNFSRNAEEIRNTFKKLFLWTCCSTLAVECFNSGM